MANRQLLAYNLDFAQEVRAAFSLCATNGIANTQTPTLTFDKAFLRANMENGAANPIAREMAYLIALKAGGGETVTKSDGSTLTRRNHFETAETLLNYVQENYQAYALGWMITYEKIAESELFMPKRIELTT